MEDPSLFAGGGGLELDGILGNARVSGFSGEEEAEAAVEEERRKYQLENEMMDAFADLVDEDDDYDDPSRSIDPSFHPAHLPTSTPLDPPVQEEKRQSLYDELAGSYHFDSYRLEQGDDHSFLHPEETVNGTTEISATPRQHFTTKDSQISFEHQHNCYSNAGNAHLATVPEVDISTEQDSLLDLDKHQPMFGNLNVITGNTDIYRQQSMEHYPPLTQPDENSPVMDSFRVDGQRPQTTSALSYDQLEILCEARGREIDHLRAEMERRFSENAEKLKQVEHKATLAIAERQVLESSQQQARQLLSQKESQLQSLKHEIDIIKRQVKALEEAKFALTSQLQTAEITISGLQSQLHEMQKSESLARNTLIHQEVVEMLKQKHDQELKAIQEQLDDAVLHLDQQKSSATRLTSDLADAVKTREHLAADKGEVINKLTASLEAAQSRCQQLLEGDTGTLSIRLASEERRRQTAEERLIDVQSELATVQRDLEACESVLGLGSGDYIQQSGKPTLFTSTPYRLPGEGESENLRRDLMKSLDSIRSHREEAAVLRRQLDQKERMWKDVQAQLDEKDRLLAETQLDKCYKMSTAEKRDSDDVAKLKRELDEAHSQNKDDLSNQHYLQDQVNAIDKERNYLKTMVDELREHLAEQVMDSDQARVEAVEEVRQSCLRLHDDVVNKLRAEKIDGYENQIQFLKDTVGMLERELEEVKGLYVLVCQEKANLSEQLQNAERLSAMREEIAAETALLSQHDKLLSEQKTVSIQVNLDTFLPNTDNKSTPNYRLVNSETQTVDAGMVSPTGDELPTYRVTESKGSSDLTYPSNAACLHDQDTHTFEKQVQTDESSENVSRLKKRLKRYISEKKLLEEKVKVFESGVVDSQEVGFSKNQTVSDCKLSEHGVLASLKSSLEEARARLRSVTEQSQKEKDELVAVYDERIELMEQSRAMDTERREQLAASHLSAECERLRAELVKQRADLVEQLSRREQDYQCTLNAYKTVMQDKAEELKVMEVELRENSSAVASQWQTESRRLMEENEKLSGRCREVMSAMQQERDHCQRETERLNAEMHQLKQTLADSRAEISSHRSRSEQLQTESESLRTRLNATRDKLRTYHEHVKQRERHYDAEFRRMEAEYRAALGKMKERIMLVRGRSETANSSISVQTDVTGQDLTRALDEILQYQTKILKMRTGLTDMLEQCQASALRPPSEETTHWRRLQSEPSVDGQLLPTSLGDPSQNRVVVPLPSSTATSLLVTVAPANNHAPYAGNGVTKSHLFSSNTGVTQSRSPSTGDRVVRNRVTSVGNDGGEPFTTSAGQFVSQYAGQHTAYVSDIHSTNHAHRNDACPEAAVMDNPLASLERIQKDMHFIFPSGLSMVAGGAFHRRSSPPGIDAVLSDRDVRIGTPPSKDSAIISLNVGT